MARTPHSKENEEFTKRAHICARKVIYPLIFECSESKLSFENTDDGKTKRHKILDGELGIDKIVKISVSGLSYPLTFTFQERFREPEYAYYRDITVTERNKRSNLPSELYKLTSGIFLYGYFDESDQDFIEVVGVNTAGLLYAIVQKKLKSAFEFNSRSSQPFVTFDFDILFELDLVLFHYRPDKYRSPRF